MEVILAIAILGLLVVSFMPVLGNSFITIFEMGSRTKATAMAQELIDKDNFVGNANLVPYTDYNAMINAPYASGVDKEGRYCIRSNTLTIPVLASGLSSESYNTVSVLIFYGNRKQQVVLTTFTRRDP